MTRSAIRKEESRWRRGDFLVITSAILFGIAMAWIVLRVQDLTSDLQTQYTARDALARQVERLGGQPVAGPPGSRGEPGKTVKGPRGQNGEKGETGKPGSPGPSGSPGKNGGDGDQGDEGSTGEPGPSGSPGAVGEQGAEGSQGEPGPAGPQGEPGPAGADGEDGADGRDGKDGQTCPDGYSLQTPAADPDALVCRRDAAPNDGGDEPAPQAAGLDPTRRQYI
jgi:hypothetical protein